jgi:hypothetical protein
MGQGSGGNKSGGGTKGDSGTKGGKGGDTGAGWPSKVEGHPSGPGRDNAEPKSPKR